MRLQGVDTPEKGGRAKCEAEREAGQAAPIILATCSFSALTVIGSRATEGRNTWWRDCGNWIMRRTPFAHGLVGKQPRQRAEAHGDFARRASASKSLSAHMIRISSECLSK